MSIPAGERMDETDPYVTDVDQIPASTATVVGETASDNALPQYQTSSIGDGGAPETATENDVTLKPPPLGPSEVKEQERREKALYRLYHTLLLLLTLRDEKAVVHLDNLNAIRLFDACLAGLITDNGVIISLPPKRVSDAAIKDWADRCDKYVPKIRARIEANNNQNVHLPKNNY